MKISELERKKILLLGYGKEGQATERFLKLFVPSARILVADQSMDPQYLDRQKEADIVIRTPGIKKELVTVPYTTATNIFFANCANPVIGVTGSKGKSTTAALIASIFKQAGKEVYLAGNIGRPMLDELSHPIGPAAVFVVELSSYQLDDIEYAPHVAVFTSLFPEHLDYHGSFEEYFAAKSRILQKQKGEDYFVYNPRFLPLCVLAQSVAAQAIPFVERLSFSTEGIHLQGEHNLDNIRGAVTAARLFGISDQDAEAAIRAFEPLPHRLQCVGEYRGIIFYDDAIATAPEATIQALKALEGVETIFLGGTDRGYDFTELAHVLAESGVKNIVLFPDTGSRIAQALRSIPSYEPTLFSTESMQEAVRFAYHKTSQGKICLLSTASPSYRLWKNFEAKGEEFQASIKEGA